MRAPFWFTFQPPDIRWANAGVQAVTLQAVRGQQVRAGTPAGTSTRVPLSTRAKDAPHLRQLLIVARKAQVDLVELIFGETLKWDYSQGRQPSASEQRCAQRQQGHQRNHPGPRQTLGSSAPGHGPAEGCLASAARCAAVGAPHHTMLPVAPTRAFKVPGRMLRKHFTGISTPGGARLPHRAEDMVVAVAAGRSERSPAGTQTGVGDSFTAFEWALAAEP